MPISTITTMSSSEAPSNFEDLVVFTATITGASTFPGGPTGTVSFYDGAISGPNLLGAVPLVGLTGATGQAQLQITSLSAVTHTIFAVYSGDSNFSGSQNAGFTQQVLVVSSGNGEIPGFAIVGTYSTSGDSSSTPAAALSAIPSSTPAATPPTEIVLLWNTTAVGQIEITGNNGQDPPFDTGRISTLGSGVYVVANGFTKTITLTLTAYDSTGHPLGLTATATVTIT